MFNAYETRVDQSLRSDRWLVAANKLTHGCLNVTKQGAMKLMQPLLDAGLVQRIGTRKTGRYILA